MDRAQHFSPQQIANFYDSKMADVNDLNVQLAQRDLITCNHNGLVPEGDFRRYEKRVNEDFLGAIHRLEIKTALFGLLHLDPAGNDTVLDAGCGAGGSGILIHRTFGSTVQGFTLSPKQAEFANNAAAHYGYSDRVKFEVGDMMALPVGDNTFDAIWACESTEHAPTLDGMYREFGRVGKDGARLVIIAWCATGDRELKRQIDRHYRTDIKPVGDYIARAEQHGWRLAQRVDLTGPTAEYWRLRSQQRNHPNGAERFMTPGFTTRGVEYYLLSFNLEKCRQRVSTAATRSFACPRKPSQKTFAEPGPYDPEASPHFSLSD